MEKLMLLSGSGLFGMGIVNLFTSSKDVFSIGLLISGSVLVAGSVSAYHLMEIHRILSEGHPR